MSASSVPGNRHPCGPPSGGQFLWKSVLDLRMARLAALFLVPMATVVLDDLYLFDRPLDPGPEWMVGGLAAAILALGWPFAYGTLRAAGSLAFTVLITGLFIASLMVILVPMPETGHEYALRIFEAPAIWSALPTALGVTGWKSCEWLARVLGQLRKGEGMHQAVRVSMEGSTNDMLLALHMVIFSAAWCIGFMVWQPEA